MPAALIPALRYADAPAIIAWLCRVLGFSTHALYPNPDGTIAHAELTFGDGMIMLGSAKDGPSGVPPDNPNAPSLYLVSPHTAQLFEQCNAAGADVLMPLQTMDYGGLAFAIRDPEGYRWSVGEYDPWVKPAATAHPGDGSA